MIELTSTFEFKQIEPSDSKIIEMFLATPDGGKAKFHPKFIQPACLDFCGEGKVGVLVSKNEQIIGMGGARFLGTKEINKNKYNAILIHSIAVDENFRRQGVGAQVIKSLIELSGQWGDRKMFVAHVQKGNLSSEKLFMKYQATFSDNHQSLLVPLRNLKGKPRSKVRLLTPDLDIPFESIERFYSEFQLFPDIVAATAWVTQKPNHKIYVCVNDNEEIVASLSVTESFKEKFLVIPVLPMIVKLLNSVFKFIPEDKMLKIIAINQLWHVENGESYLREILNHIANLYEQEATTAAISFAKGTIISKNLGASWWMPKSNSSTVVFNIDGENIYNPYIW